MERLSENVKLNSVEEKPVWVWPFFSPCVCPQASKLIQWNAIPSIILSGNSWPPWLNTSFLSLKTASQNNIFQQSWVRSAHSPPLPPAGWFSAHAPPPMSDSLHIQLAHVLCFPLLCALKEIKIIHHKVVCYMSITERSNNYVVQKKTAKYTFQNF